MNKDNTANKSKRVAAKQKTKKERKKNKQTNAHIYIARYEQQVDTIAHICMISTSGHNKPMNFGILHFNTINI